MAIYHLHVRFVKRSEGRSSVAAAAYRAGEKLRDDYRGETFDFRHKADQVEHKRVLCPDYVPEHLANRQALWGTVEETLNYKTGQPAFEVEMALPRELTHEQRVELAEGFAQREFVDKGLIVDLCIHNVPASDGGEHPHVHCLVTTRRFDEEGRQGKAARDLQDSPSVLKRVYALEQEGKLDEALLASKDTHLAGWRERWADDANAFLERYSHADRVDHRTLAAQKIEREPSPNIGFAFYDRLRELKGHLADRVGRWQQVNIAESVHEKLQLQYHRIRDHYPQMQAEFLARAREYGQKFWPELNKEPQLGRGHEHER